MADKSSGSCAAVVGGEQAASGNSLTATTAGRSQQQQQQLNRSLSFTCCCCCCCYNNSAQNIRFLRHRSFNDFLDVRTNNSNNNNNRVKQQHLNGVKKEFLNVIFLIIQCYLKYFSRCFKVVKHQNKKGSLNQYSQLEKL